MNKIPPMARQGRQELESRAGTGTCSLSSPFRILRLEENVIKAYLNAEKRGLATGPKASHCVMGMALIILGLGLNLYNAGEVLATLVFSGILVLLLGLVLSGALLIWEGGKQILAWGAFRAWPGPPRRPVVLARLGCDA